MKFFALLLVACGSGPSAQISSNVTLAQGLQSSDIQSLEITVAENTDSTGKPLTCDSVGTQWIIEDATAQIRFDTLLTPANTTVGNIPTGTGLVVVLSAFSSANGLGTRIAQACVENVSIKGGQTTSVNLVLEPLSN